MASPSVIITGHDAETGASVFLPHIKPKALSIPSSKPDAQSPSGSMIYHAEGSVIDLNNNADLNALADRDSSRVFPTEGSVALMVEWLPETDGRTGIHRTQSADVCVVIEGEMECHLDSGESRILKQGDVLIQRGTKHAWVNRSQSVTAKMLFFITASKPIEGVKP